MTRTLRADHYRIAGVGATAAAVLVWGTTSVLVKQVEGVSGPVLSFHRLWIGAVLTLAAFLASGRRITWRLLRLSLPGGAAFALDIVLFFTALRETSVANATVIGALQPVLLLALAQRLFGEHPMLTDAFWACVAIAGSVIVVTGGTAGGEATTHGDLLAVGALLAWTWYFVASKRARVEMTSFEYLTGLSLVAAVVLAPFVLLGGEPLGVGRTTDWVLIVLIAVVNGALGHFLLNWAHAHVPIVVVSLMTLAIPVVSSAIAAVTIDEPITVTQAGGMAVVVVALAFVVTRTSRAVPDVVDSAVAAGTYAPTAERDERDDGIEAEDLGCGEGPPLRNL